MHAVARGRGGRAVPLALVIVLAAGCRVLPGGGGPIRTESAVRGNFRAAVDIHLPSGQDPGPMVPSVVRASPAGANCASRVAVIDVDGLLVNQNQTGLYSAGENPVAAFREKLEAAAGDGRVRAIVVRVNSPGGGVTASDIMGEELRRFRAATNKPAVACLMDLATGGAYYLAIGCDVVVAHPTAIVGGVGAIVNHYNLQDAMAQLNVTADPIKAGDLVDMGSVTTPLADEARALLQATADSFRDRFAARVAERRPGMAPRDRKTVADGRVVPATLAIGLHMVDRLGYVDDAIAEAQGLAGLANPEVVLYQRAGSPARSLYAITPNVPLHGEIVPFSYPGLDRAKLPTFLYLWQPDPTLAKAGGR